MRRNAIGQRQKGSEPRLPGFPEILRVVEALSAAEQRADGDHQDINQRVILRSISRMIFFGERSPRQRLDNHVAHYRTDRNHQGKDSLILLPVPAHRVGNSSGEVRTHERLAGLLNSITGKPHETFDHAGIGSYPQARFSKLYPRHWDPVTSQRLDNRSSCPKTTSKLLAIRPGTCMLPTRREAKVNLAESPRCLAGWKKRPTARSGLDDSAPKYGLYAVARCSCRWPGQDRNRSSAQSAG